MAATALAQQAAAPPKPHFEVASVKQVREGQSGIASGQVAVRGVFRFANVTLEQLIRYAYSVQSFAPVAGGPAWVHPGRHAINFVVEARYPADAPDKEVRLMLQTLLARRFRLKLHTKETRATVYELIASHGKPSQLQPLVEGRPRVPMPCPAVLEAYHPAHFGIRGPMATFATLLSRFYKLPVIDNTNLPGKFNFAFCYPMPDRPIPKGMPPPPPIREALKRQLGLDLVMTKGIITAYAVDSASLPAGN